MKDSKARHLAAAASKTAGITAAAAPLRNVASRCQIPHRSDTAKNVMCRSYRRIWSDVRRIKLVLSNGYVDSSNEYIEAPRGSPTTFRASISVAGQPHLRFLWNGSASAIIPDLSHCESDWLDVDISAGTLVCNDIWADNQATGVCVSTNKVVAALGDICALGTGTADSTMGQAFTGNTTTSSLHPSAIIAETTDGSVIIIGDSNGFGAVGDAGDTEDGGCVGPIERSIATMPFINVSVPGDWLYFCRNSFAWRMELSRYCSVGIVHYGGNDISNSRNTAALDADRQAMAAILTQYDLPTYLTTLRPRTSSTDSFKAPADQTVESGAKETVRTNENTSRLAIPAGWAGTFDISSVVTSGGNAWIGNGTPFYATPDGVHYSMAASKLVRDSGLISVTALKAWKSALRKYLPPRSGSRTIRRRTASLTMSNDFADGSVITNHGAGSQVNFTLPSPTDGQEYTFVNVTASGLRVTCATGSSVTASSINIGGTTSTTGGNVTTTTIGAVLRLIAIADVWYALHSSGTWTAA